MSKARPARRPPGLLLQALESRVGLEFYSCLWAWPLLHRARRGDGHPVLVIPGFLASGTSTYVLRTFLRDLGYRGHRWKLGKNLGPVGEVEQDILVRLRELRRRYGRKVSVIGWSLGGVYARELARQAPGDVRQVITLGSPVREYQSSAVSWLYNWVTDQSAETLPPEFIAQSAESPPVPTTSVYSRTDGIVPWRCSLEKSAPLAENVRVESSHLGMGVHPAVLWLIADRLAQQEGAWQPFRARGWARALYPRADSHREKGPAEQRQATRTGFSATCFRDAFPGDS